MPIALTGEQLALYDVAVAFLQRAGAMGDARSLLDATDEHLPGYWPQIADLGWLGLHVPQEHGGEGCGLAEVAVVLEAMGRMSGPGAFLPTVWAAAVLVVAGDPHQQRTYLPRIADGSIRGCVGIDESDGMVLGAGQADLFLLPQGEDLIIVNRDEVTVHMPTNVDGTRRSGVVRLVSSADPGVRRLVRSRGWAVEIGRVLAAAEAAGGAQRCLEMSAEYAKVREQFGRPIGTFQAVKHHVANMMTATQLAVAATWDAVQAEPGSNDFSLASAIAASQSLRAFSTCAGLNIQVHGGMGYTWEHDAHVFLKRAFGMEAIFGPVPEIDAQVTELAAAGGLRRKLVNLPPDAAVGRAEVRAFLAAYEALEADEGFTALLDSGYAVPHWPRPWGRAATVVEQLVIEEEFEAAGVTGLDFGNHGIGGWILQTLLQHGSPEQVGRWVRPSLEGVYTWCQMFSEPGAGSDAAAIRTAAERCDGGWVLNGQKVWTSGATWCNWGLITVRTDPSAPKHSGITVMAVDLAANGVQVRPIREASGREGFAEVFLDEVFVPDSDVVGAVGEGWKVARSTFGNERVSIGRGVGDSEMIFDLVDVYRRHSFGDRAAAASVGRHVAEGRALDLMNLRAAERALQGAEPGPESSITKLLMGEHLQRRAAIALRLVGSRAAFTEGPDAAVAGLYVRSRSYTIAGGTSEILRNQIAERLLGLPRDPLTR